MIGLRIQQGDKTMKVIKIEVEPAMGINSTGMHHYGPWDVIFTTKDGKRFKLTSDAHRINNEVTDPE